MENEPPNTTQVVTRLLRHEIGDLLQSVYATVAILSDRLPGVPRLGNGLVRSSLVLAPQRETQRLGGGVRARDQACFWGMAGSVTRTTPARR